MPTFTAKFTKYTVKGGALEIQAENEKEALEQVRQIQEDFDAEDMVNWCTDQDYDLDFDGFSPPYDKPAT